MRAVKANTPTCCPTTFRGCECRETSGFKTYEVRVVRVRDLERWGVFVSRGFQLGVTSVSYELRVTRMRAGTSVRHEMKRMRTVGLNESLK